MIIQREQKKTHEWQKKVPLSADIELNDLIDYNKKKWLVKYTDLSNQNLNF